MRIKLQGTIIEGQTSIKTSYNHEMYSMILTNISTERAIRIHEKKRFKRLFTFSNLYIVDNKVHFYVSGQDELIKDFINCIMFNQIIRIGDRVINITNIEPLKNLLETKQEYIFKSNFIVNEMENNKVCLSKNNDYIIKRISDIARDKYKEIFNEEIQDKLNVEIIKSKHKYTRYKNHYLNSYQMLLKIKGDKRLIDLIYNLGIGENTASGHGFVWEVS
jgi:CRISPR-associated endoribonuclease Cas6